MYWAYPAEQARARSRRRILAFGGMLVLLVVMFFVILPSERHGTSQTSTLLNLGNRGYAAYVVLYMVTVGVGQVVTLRASAR
jgi:type II secretory pathway component PulM